MSLVDIPDLLGEWPCVNKLHPWQPSCDDYFFPCSSPAFFAFWYCGAHFNILAIRRSSSRSVAYFLIGPAKIPLFVPGLLERHIGAQLTNGYCILFKLWPSWTNQSVAANYIKPYFPDNCLFELYEELLVWSNVLYRKLIKFLSQNTLQVDFGNIS